MKKELSQEEILAIREKNKQLLVNRDNSLIPPIFLYDKERLNGEGSPYSDQMRDYQGIPSIESTGKGRLFSVFYTGKGGEGVGNYLLLQYSDDGGRHFSPPFLAVMPNAEGVRCFDPGLWSSPDGRLHLYWNQSFGYFDGRSGVWCATCDDPDAEEPRFGPPQRIANGVMMCKPVEISSGDWLLPAGVWRLRPHYDAIDVNESAWKCDNNVEGFYYLPEEIHPNVYISRDKGKTWAYHGSSKVEWFTFPEHMVFEKTDGALGMYLRAFGKNGLGYAESKDGGKTWTEAYHTEIYNPDTRFCVRRLPSGRLLMANHILGEKRQRNNLALLLSEDDGATWSAPLLIDERLGVSYPDIAFTPDGYICVIYDFGRHTEKEILMAKVKEEDILARAIVNKGSALRLLVNRAYGKAQ